ncbi:MAG: hypothetical protein GY929_12540 [Actinomycetia bacterium]|nr:hypothetical protein [Actinomycetes bacterium]
MTSASSGPLSDLRVLDLTVARAGPTPIAAGSTKSPVLGATRSAAPDAGQHTDEVLGELGLWPERLAAFRDAGVI